MSSTEFESLTAIETTLDEWASEGELGDRAISAAVQAAEDVAFSRGWRPERIEQNLRPQFQATARRLEADAMTTYFA